MNAVTRKNRETGTYITVGNADQDGWCNSGGDFYTLCEDHGQIINHETVSQARGWASNPTSWCETCQHNFCHNDKPDWACAACDETEEIMDAKQKMVDEFDLGSHFKIIWAS